MGRRRRGARGGAAAAAGAAAAVGPEEAARRERQRELQAIAREKQARGQGYSSKSLATLRNRRLQHAGVAAGRGKAKGARGERKPEVVVLPICWRSREDEARSVMDAGARARDLLKANDVVCRLDPSQAHTPGKKMRMWEEQGVAVRLELGPQDVRRGTVTLAKARGVGEVAEKRVLKLREAAALVKAVWEMLGKPEGGQVVLPEAAGVPGAGGASPGEGGEAAAPPGPGKAAPEAAGAAARRGPSGDDLEGDFAEVAAEDEPLPKRPKKSKISHGQGRGEGPGEEGEKKKAKVVSF